MSLKNHDNRANSGSWAGISAPMNLVGGFAGRSLLFLLLFALATLSAQAADVAALLEQEQALNSRYIEALSANDSSADAIKESLDQLRAKIQECRSGVEFTGLQTQEGSLPEASTAVQVETSSTASVPSTAARTASVEKSLRDFLKEGSSQAGAKGLIEKAKSLLDEEKFADAVEPLRQALDKARQDKDPEAVEEAGANLVYALYRSGDTDGAMKALKQHESDKIPALEKRIEESLSGTSFDPAFREMLTQARAIWQDGVKSSAVWGEKPGFLSHFNPFYQASRIKAYSRQKSFHKSMGGLLNSAYKSLSQAKTGGSASAIARAEANYQALSILSTDFSENPDTRISDNEVELFDPANLFASSETALYDSVEEAYEHLLPAIEVSQEEGMATTQLLNVNSKAWHARWYMIKSARRKIDTTYFIIDPDIFGSAFLGLLLEKAREGVQIRLMMDDRGVKKYTKTFKGVDYVQELMTFSNVQVKTFNPIKKNIARVFLGVSKVMASNHDKIIVIDDELCMTGGRNVAAHYFADPEDCDDIFRDTDVMMRSRGVAKQLTLAFDEEFARMRNVEIHKDLFGNFTERATELDISRTVVELYQQGSAIEEIREKLLARYPDHEEAVNERVDEMAKFPATAAFNEFKAFPDTRKMPVTILDKHSTNDDRNDITRGLISMMDSAHEQIIIENPYVVLSKRARAALVRASRRGVKISIITNNPESSEDGYNDMALTQSMFLLDWKELKRDCPTLRVYAMKGPNRLHAKVFVFDRKVAVIGTYNMDPMSEQINSEVVASVRDDAFADATAKAIEEDISVKGLEYTIEIDSNGEIREKTGPSDYFDPKVLKKLKLLGKLKLIRPLI